MSETNVIRTFVCPKCHGGWEQRTDAVEVPCRYRPGDKTHKGVLPSRNIERGR